MHDLGADAALPEFIRGTSAEVPEPDLVLPSSRASPLNGLRIKRRIQSPLPQPKRSHRGNRMIERLAHELQATREELRQTKRTVRRLNAVVDDYQSRYPDHTVPRSSLARRLERGEIREHPEPLLKAYDEQLAKREKDVQGLESELARVVEKAREVVQDNEQCQESLEKMKKRIETVEAENAELKREQAEMEMMLEKGVTADKLSRELAPQLDDLRQLSATQKRTIEALQADNDVLQQKVSEFAEQKEAALGEVRRMANLQLVLERRTEEAELEAEKCASQAEKWKAWAGAVEDYKRCLAEVGMTKLLNTGVPPASGDARGVLFGSILKLKKEAQVAKRRCEVLDHHAREIERRASLSAHKAQMEVEKRAAELESCRAHLKEVVGTAGLAREEREAARREAIASAREASRFAEEVQLLIEKHRAEIRELMDKSQGKIKELQEQYDVDRRRLCKEIDELQKSRVDMQCEIGMLIRDKRAIELNMRDAINSMYINRDKFRQSLGILSSSFRLEDVLRQSLGSGVPSTVK